MQLPSTQIPLLLQLFSHTLSINIINILLMYYVYILCIYYVYIMYMCITFTSTALVAQPTMTVAFYTTTMKGTVIDTILDSTIQPLISIITLTMSLYTSTLITAIIETLFTFTCFTSVASSTLAEGYLIIRSNTYALTIAVLRTVLERTIYPIIRLITSTLISSQVTHAMSRTIISTGSLGTISAFEPSITLAST